MQVMCSSFTQEPMEGSASMDCRWLLWEHTGAYPATIEDFPPEISSRPLRIAHELNARLLFIRQFAQKKSHCNDDTEQRRIFYSEGEELRILTIYNDRPEQTIESKEILTAPVSAHPIFLVCTNGKRDMCCAIHGRKLLHQLQESSYSDYLWESSHIGAHRFAPLLLALPSGYVYGRLTPSIAETIMQHSLEDTIYPCHLRGKSGLNAREQVADIAVRRRYAPLSVQATEVMITDDPDTAIVIVHQANTPDQKYCVRLSQKTFSPRPASCGGKFKGGVVPIVESVQALL